MSEQTKRELIDAAARAMADFNALDTSAKVDVLKRIGILGEDGELSERYGGPGTDGPQRSVYRTPLGSSR